MPAAKTKRPIVCELPLQLKSEANCRDHWADIMRRKQAQRGTVYLLMKRHRDAMRALLNDGPVLVNCVRIRAKGRRALDDDNLRGAFKAVRDEIAKMLGADDADPRILFDYAQEQGKEYGVRIEILPREVVTVGAA